MINESVFILLVVVRYHVGEQMIQRTTTKEETSTLQNIYDTKLPLLENILSNNINKNLAIANRSCVSYAQNSSRASP